MLNCVFKNHFFQIAHFKIVILNSTFLNRKLKRALSSNVLGWASSLVR